MILGGNVYAGGPGNDFISFGGGNTVGAIAITGDNYDTPGMILTEDATGLN